MLTDNKVYTALNWEGLDFSISYQVYKGMRMWLEERDIEYRFEYNNGAYMPVGVIMDAESTIAFKLIF